MNYIAHLYFALSTPDSHFGNLLGDFRRGTDLSVLNQAVKKGLENHYLIDKYTDTHPLVRASVKLFSPPHRRFAPVALDILYDHFLIAHWQQYQEQNGYADFDTFCANSYALLAQRVERMPDRMQQVVQYMIDYHGLAAYQDLDGVNKAIERVANRIRFKNTFAQSVSDIEQHYDELAHHFSCFFPDLVNYVKKHSPERV